MKLQRFVGADSHVGSLVASVNGRVAIRSAVVRQMKKPIEKSIMRPMREPIDILRLKITGMGRMNMMMSVNRLRMALDHLCQKKLMHVPGMVRLYTRGTGVHWKIHTKTYETVQPTDIAIKPMHAWRKRWIGKTR